MNKKLEKHFAWLAKRTALRKDLREAKRRGKVTLAEYEALEQKKIKDSLKDI